MAIPVLGRLSVREWPVIIISITLAWFEYVISIISILLPEPVIDMFTLGVRTIYSFGADPIRISQNETWTESTNSFPYMKHISNGTEVNGIDDPSVDFEVDKYHLMIDILNSPDFESTCSLFGYDVESHIIRTKDNYLLTAHRIVRPGSHIARNGKVIYLHHGLLMSSDIWVTMLERHQNLPFLLYDLGYDVWLGNNRGNKYSQKHLFLKTHSEKFWDFSLDEFALFDIPNTIDYILSETKVEKLTYIGFSQGSAQAFASISVNSYLKDKIDQMIAISPATTPHGLYSKFLDILLKASPSLVYLLFLRKILMPSVILWQQLMYPPFFDTMIDISNYMLFNWRLKNITKMQKLASYAHLYSTTSVKCVVHWFQVISSRRFQMFRDSQTSMSGFSPIYYPLKNIKVPIHLIYGELDSLVDIEVMKKQLPLSTTTTLSVPGHEHLDNIWGHDIKEMVFKHVLACLGEDSGTSQLQPSNVKSAKSYLQFERDPAADALFDASFDGEETIHDGKYVISNGEFKINQRKPSTGGSVFV